MLLDAAHLDAEFEESAQRLATALGRRLGLFREPAPRRERAPRAPRQRVRVLKGTQRAKIRPEEAGELHGRVLGLFTAETRLRAGEVLQRLELPPSERHRLSLQLRGLVARGALRVEGVRAGARYQLPGTSSIAT